MDQVPDDGLSHHKEVHEEATCWRFVGARRRRRMGCLGGGISRVGELNLGSLEPGCLVPKPAGWLVPGSVISYVKMTTAPAPECREIMYGKKGQHLACHCVSYCGEVGKFVALAATQKRSRPNTIAQHSCGPSSAIVVINYSDCCRSFPSVLPQHSEQNLLYPPPSRGSGVRYLHIRLPH